jgi:hypothetical protein
MPSFVIFGSTMISGSIIPVVVTPPPIANPEDLIYTLGGNGLTTAGVSGQIFGVGGVNNIIKDNVTPHNWYHGAYVPITINESIFYDFSNINISNAEINIISPIQTRGILERAIGQSWIVFNVQPNVNPIYTTIKINTSTLQVYDRILVQETNIPDGIYLIVAKTSAGGYDYIDIFYNSTNDPLYVSYGSVKKYTYLWDEVFTSPIGLYSQVVSPITPPGSAFEFAIIGDNSNNIQVVIDDPNIIPKIDDYLVIQKIHSNTINPTTLLLSTTDGVNNIINIPSAETWVFKITNVTFIDNVFSITLDKSFTAPITSPADPKFMFILLNRKNLYTQTWELHEIHRKQLLGDPYEYIGIALPSGRTNYLYYQSAKYLGIENLLKDIINSDDTPFILLHYNDNIKDRIYDSLNSFEVHLPNVLIHGEKTPTILTNKTASILDSTGCGYYAPLYMKYSSQNIIYGYIFYDLRIIIIDHPEVAMAMAYNSNRNFSLPKGVLPKAGNALVNSNINAPLLIETITPGAVTKIKTTTKHNLQDGDAITIKGITIYPDINTPVGSYYYIKKSTTPNPSTEFFIYKDNICTIPVAISGNIIQGSGATCYSNKLPYEYFLTYRLTSENYESLPCAFQIPFNFETHGDLDNNYGYVELDVEFLTHLICANGNIEGFNADNIELIIGKYKQSLVDPSTIESIAEVKLVKTISLFTNLNQNNLHKLITDVPGYNAAPIYDIINNQPIYNSIIIPETIFTGEGKWVLGNIIWKEHAKQYRLTFDVTIPADKWNGTINKTFEPGNVLMPTKFISEIAFLITGNQQNVNDEPYVYAKVTPVIKKSNQADIKLKISVDF